MTIKGKVIISQLELHAYHGWHPHEGEFGQPYTIDLELLTDLTRPAGSDHLVKVRTLRPAPGQGLHGLCDRAQLGVFPGQADDLRPVGRRAHARFHLVEAVEDGIELGLGQVHGVRGRS